MADSAGQGKSAACSTREQVVSTLARMAPQVGDSCSPRPTVQPGKLPGRKERIRQIRRCRTQVSSGCERGTGKGLREIHD